MPLSVRAPLLATACLMAAACAASPTAPSATPAARAPRLSRTRFLAFGDSLTSGEVTVPAVVEDEPVFGGSPALSVIPSASYPMQLLSQLAARYGGPSAGIEMINAGMSGETALDGAARLPDAIAAAGPEAVLLLEGVNDLAAFGAGGALPAAIAVQTMVRDARARGARVFLATLPPGRPGGRNSPVPALLQTFNDYIRQIAVLDDAVLVDLYAALLPDVETCIGVDGLHPTEAGYERIAGAFFAAIRDDLELR